MGSLEHVDLERDECQPGPEAGTKRGKEERAKPGLSAKEPEAVPSQMTAHGL
jgi:hypothetical protein